MGNEGITRVGIVGQISHLAYDDLLGCCPYPPAQPHFLPPLAIREGYRIRLIINNIMEVIKRKRRCEVDCRDHLLILQCLRPNSSKYDVKLAFCPKFQRDPLPPEYIHPEFNNDYKYYTSAFILGVDRRALVKNEQQQIMDHQKQVRDSLQKHNQLIFPRPNSKHSHCSVCKEHYKNYYLHVSSEEHREKIAASLYNVHIKELCGIYVELWRGGEERADEAAERMAAEEVERRERLTERLARERVEEAEEESLLDVQRGEGEGDDEEYEEEYVSKSKSHKRARPPSHNDDTVPIRSYKRSASGRTYQSEYLRRKFQLNHPVTSEHAFREREERKYEREREKVRTERDLHPNKEFIKINEKEDDVFIIMKASYTVAQGIGEFVWKRTADRVKKEAERSDKAERERERERERAEATPEIENENKKYEIHYQKQEKGEKGEGEKGKYEHKPYNYYPYPAYSDHKGEHFKGFQDSKPHDNPSFCPDSKTNPESYKQPYYYPYYNMYDQYPRDPREHSKGYDYKQKERGKGGEREKGYEYPPYQWPYHPPYYMPPQPQPPIPQQEQPVAKAGNTNININFPMYMCPPPHSYGPAPRYPPAHPAPYYDYPPYPQTHPTRDPHPQPVPQFQGPPMYSGQHYQPPYQLEKKGAAVHPHHSSFPAQPHAPPQGQSYPPYMHHYQQHYPPQYPPPHSPPSKF